MISLSQHRYVRMKEMQSESQCILGKSYAQTRIRPPVHRFSQTSLLFCRGKHQGAQREEQTNNKLTHSPVTLCLDCKHKRARVCVYVCVCCIQSYSKLQAPEREGRSSCTMGPWIKWHLADFVSLTFPECKTN